MTATDETGTHRPGPRAWLALMGAEARMVVRDTSGLVVPLGLPLLILLMSGSSATDIDLGGGLTAFDVFVQPLACTIIIAMIGIVNMPSFLAYYRHSGILRRLAVTPASPAMVLIAQVVVSLVQALLGLALALTVAFGAFGASVPTRPLMAVAVFGLALAAMYSLGMMVAAVAPSPNAAVAIGLVLFFALGALGGMFGGPEALPGFLHPVVDWLPFGASVQALGAAWVGADVTWPHLVALAATTVLGSLASAVFFRWD